MQKEGKERLELGTCANSLREIELCTPSAVAPEWPLSSVVTTEFTAMLQKSVVNFHSCPVR